MTLIGREKLLTFIRKHTDARNWVNTWIADVEHAEWKGPQQIKDRYKTASFLSENIVFFNVKGNSYRLQVQIAYGTGKIIVKWIGTHGEYTKLFC